MYVKYFVQCLTQDRYATTASMFIIHLMHTSAFGWGLSGRKAVFKDLNDK